MPHKLTRNLSQLVKPFGQLLKVLLQKRSHPVVLHSIRHVGILQTHRLDPPVQLQTHARLQQPDPVLSGRGDLQHGPGQPDRLGHVQLHHR
jgi:hypothetical protein